MEKLEPSCIAGRTAKLCSHFENNLAVLQKSKRKVTISPNNSVPRYLPKRTENICLYEDLYVNINSNITDKGPKLETIQTFINS